MKIYLSYGQEDAPDGFKKLTPEEFEFIPFEEINAQHVLDKIPDLIGFFEKLHECIGESKATFVQYYYRSPMASLDPRTIREFSEVSLSWLSKGWRELNKELSPKTDIDFVVQYSCSVDPILETRSADAKAFAMLNYAGSISAVQFILTKK